jgi:hypothetical protein
MPTADPPTDPTASRGREAPSVPALVRLLALGVMLVVPLRVLGTGFLPPDDALRHAAKVVSGRAWAEILVLRGDVAIDPHAGWHALLGLVHRATGADAHALVLIAVVTLFLVVHLVPLLSLRRPEAWLMSWLGLCVLEPPALVRFMLGRPFLASIAALVTLGLLWRRLAVRRLDYRAAALCTLAVALAAWIHPSWYLFALFLGAVLVAGERRAALRLTACVGAGVFLAAALSGQFGAFLWESARHPFLVLGTMDARTLVVELRPNGNPPFVLFGILGLLAWRALRGEWREEVLRDPLLILAAGGWVLGYASLRFWSDWGLPAALVWAALEIQSWLEEHRPAREWRRLGMAAAVGLSVFVASANDVMGRWSLRMERTYLPLLRPDAALWLPEPGGILYCPDVMLFHQLFYHRPDAPWRYMVGFEPGLLPPDDLAVYREFLKEGTLETLRPWVRKMRPPDRLVVVLNGPAPPALAELEWKHLGGLLWSGRTPPSGRRP